MKNDGITAAASSGRVASHGGFIASIEGMRALAVLAVLLFHLDISGIASGFLGVDLFFVISGFIITRNIQFDLHRSTFSLKEFYLRRFRRLFPALLVTVLLTLLFALAVVPPLELEKTAGSAIYALFSLANFNFWLEAGYFDAAAHSKPLLHTWSLSVEEQFYLFWPALLLLLANSRRRLQFTLLILLLSLAASLLWRNSIPDAIFYLLPFRVHQLMAGAVIAILALRLPGQLGNMSALLASTGFVVASVAISSSYPPAVGAASVTVLGFFLLLGRESAAAQLVFGNRLMQWVGKRSYAIYLVHWPIIVLFKFATDFQLDVPERVLLFVSSILAAIVLHELVEKPFRKRGEDATVAQRMAMPATVSVLALTVVVAVAIAWMEGLPGRFDGRIQKLVDSVDSEVKLRRQAIRFGTCNLHKQFTFDDYDKPECTKVDPARLNVLVIGDSMAADTYMMLSQAYPDIQFSQATAGACTALLEITDVRGKYPACEELNAYRFSELLDLEMDLIVLASIWTEDRIQPLKETVGYLHSRGKRVLVIGPRSVYPGSVPLLISKQQSLEAAIVELPGRVAHKKDLLDKMRLAMPDVEIVDIGAIQCATGCGVIEEERLLYFDAMHFTRLGAQRVGERFREAFDLPGFISTPVLQKAPGE